MCVACQGYSLAPIWQALPSWICPKRSGLKRGGCATGAEDAEMNKHFELASELPYTHAGVRKAFWDTCCIQLFSYLWYFQRRWLAKCFSFMEACYETPCS